MKFKIILGVSIIVFTAISIAGLKYTAYVSWLNLVILSLTLFVLVWYAYDTHRITVQTIETNLRPIILRSGFVKKWEDVVFDLTDKKLDIVNPPLSFKVFKNIATDIEGYIIINRKKFTLLFGNEISKLSETPDGNVHVQFNPSWGWMEPNSLIHAIYDSAQFKSTEQENGLFIAYKDVEGNIYCTKEDRNFSQISYRK